MLYSKVKNARASERVGGVSSYFAGIKKAIVLLPVALTGVLAATAAQAATVVGSVTLAASFGFVVETGSDAGIDFVDFGLGNPSPSFDTDVSTARIQAVSGDFATIGIVPGSFVDVKDFRFDLAGVDNPIVIGSIFEFSITSVVPPSIFSGSGLPGAGDFSGSGVLHDTSGTYDDTLYDFTFNNINGAIALVTNTATGNPVPVPGAVWLFGSALLGLAARKRLA